MRRGERFSFVGDSPKRIAFRKERRRHGRLRRHAALATRVEMRRNAFGLIPRYLIETLAVAGVILFLLHLAGRGEPLASMLPVLALYLLAGYRILPALQSIYANLGQMRFNRAALVTLHQDLEEARSLQSAAGAAALATTPLPFQREIRLEAMSFAYPQAASPALRDVNLVIRKNTSVAFVGATGAGKSTLVDLVMGLLLPVAGRVLIDDVPVELFFAPYIEHARNLPFDVVGQTRQDLRPIGAAEAVHVRLNGLLVPHSNQPPRCSSAGLTPLKPDGS